jgi:hypothetical protein
MYSIIKITQAVRHVEVFWFWAVMKERAVNVGGKSPLRVVLQQLGVAGDRSRDIGSALRDVAARCNHRGLDGIDHLREAAPLEARLRHRLDVPPDSLHIERAWRGGTQSTVQPTLEELQRGVTSDNGVPCRTPLRGVGERFDVHAVWQVGRARTCGHTLSPGRSVRNSSDRLESLVILEDVKLPLLRPDGKCSPRVPQRLRTKRGARR